MAVMATESKNAEDIKQLTVTVTRIATIVENAENRYQNDIAVIRQAMENISKLNERFGSVVSMEKDIGTLTGDVRTIRHDLNNVINGMKAIDILATRVTDNEKDISSHEARITNIETWKNQHDGATGAFKGIAKALWAVFGTGIVAIGGFILYMFFTFKQLPVPPNIPGGISGE